MKRSVWSLFLALALIGALIVIGRSGLYPREFSMEWNEEVRLHDGQTIVVRMKRTFERYERFDRWAARPVDTELEFDYGPPLGRLARVFQGYNVNMIENKNGNWYFSLSPTTGVPPIKLVSQKFPVLIVSKNGDVKTANSWDDIPNFPCQNVMPVTPSPKGIAKFRNTLLTWDVKMEHWKNNPRAAGDDGIRIQRHINN